MTLFTDLGFFLDPETGRHLERPRLCVRGQPPRLLDPDPADGTYQVPGLVNVDDLVAHILSLYHNAGNCDGLGHDAVPYGDPTPPVQLSGQTAASGAPPPHHPLRQLDWGIMWRDVPLRLTYQRTAKGLLVAISRGLWPVPSLEKLGHNPWFAARLRQAMTKPGLIVVIGHMGAGKTTTMWSALLDHVERTSCMAVVLEDVTEMPAEGHYGTAGHISQIVIQRSGFGSHIPHIMRLRAQQLMINEIRDHHTAREVLLAANRVSIITTSHGNSIPAALCSIRDLAAGTEGGAWAATSLANSLVAAVHLRSIVPDGKGGFSIDVEALFVDGPSEDAIRQIIRHNEMIHLRSHASQQAASNWGARPSSGLPQAIRRTAAPPGPIPTKAATSGH